MRVLFQTFNQVITHCKNVRILTLPLLLVSALTASASTSEIKILNLYRELIPANDFRRISEFFTGKENQGRRTIIRTQPNEYEGYYFILRLNEKVSWLPENSKVKLEVTYAGQIENTLYTFLIPKKENVSNEIFVGITGEDWTYSTTDIIAWRVTLLTAEETIITQKQSFLW